jgi:hypothetical protein
MRRRSSMSHSSDLCGVQAYDLGDRTVIRFTGPRVLLDEENISLVGRLTLRHLHPRLYEVFRVTRLHTVFDIQSGACGSGSGSGVGP